MAGSRAFLFATEGTGRLAVLRRGVRQEIQRGEKLGHDGSVWRFACRSSLLELAQRRFHFFHHGAQVDRRQAVIGLHVGEHRSGVFVELTEGRKSEGRWWGRCIFDVSIGAVCRPEGELFSAQRELTEPSRGGGGGQRV